MNTQTNDLALVQANNDTRSFYVRNGNTQVLAFRRHNTSIIMYDERKKKSIDTPLSPPVDYNDGGEFGEDMWY